MGEDERDDLLVPDEAGMRELAVRRPRKRRDFHTHGRPHGRP